LAYGLLIFHIDPEENKAKGFFTMENQEKVPASNQSKSLDTDKLKGKAIEVADEIKARGKDQLEAGKKTAAEGVEQLAGALDQATESLERGEQQSLAGYAQELASNVRSLAANLRDRSLDDLVTDTQALARRNPTLFFFGTIAVGIALSRFLKSSGERQESRFPDNIMPSSVVSPTPDWQGTRESVDIAQAPDHPEADAVHTKSPPSAFEQKGV
jgi:hypothetical protein